MVLFLPLNGIALPLDRNRKLQISFGSAGNWNAFAAVGVCRTEREQLHESIATTLANLNKICRCIR